MQACICSGERKLAFEIDFEPPDGDEGELGYTPIDLGGAKEGINIEAVKKPSSDLIT